METGFYIHYTSLRETSDSLLPNVHILAIQTGSGLGLSYLMSLVPGTDRKRPTSNYALRTLKAIDRHEIGISHLPITISQSISD